MQICVRVAAMLNWQSQQQQQKNERYESPMKKTEIWSVRRVSSEYWFKLSQNTGCETVFATGIIKTKNWKMTRSNGRIMYLKIYFDLVRRPAAHIPAHVTFAIHNARARSHTHTKPVEHLSS